MYTRFYGYNYLENGCDGFYTLGYLFRLQSRGAQAHQNSPVGMTGHVIPVIT